jgi:hypothetical protein
MKTKNVILGLCALVFAVGSAFATLSFDVKYVKVDTRQARNPEVCVDQTAVCVPLPPATCTTGEFTCMATVISTALSGGSDPAPVRNSSCSLLTNQSATPVVTLTDQCITAVY